MGGANKGALVLMRSAHAWREQVNEMLIPMAVGKPSEAPPPGYSSSGSLMSAFS